jgi:tetratricopeptide (TPR) repeat protein/transglutaminase-like putative cysteine protease
MSHLAVAETNSTSSLSFEKLATLKAAQASDVILSKAVRRVRIDSSGAIEIHTTLTFRSQSEAGRVQLGLREIPFDANQEDVKLLSAATINGTVRTPVSLRTVTTKSVSEKSTGIENAKKLVVPFNNVLASSSVELVYQNKVRPLLPGSAILTLFFDQETPTLEYEVYVESEKTFQLRTFGTYVSRNSKGERASIYSVALSQPKGRHAAEIKTLAPVFLKHELKDKSLITQDDVPALYISTAESWSSIAKQLALQYQTKIAEPLPSEFVQIRDLASKETSDRMKLDRIQYEVSKLVAYSGNWVTLERGFFPKGHAAVIAEKKGDCKDFATSIAAIARSLGFKADIALVESNNPFIRPLKDAALGDLIPSTDYFNHAVTKVYGNDGTVYWLDGTRSTPSSGIPAVSFTDSPALVLNAASTGLERVQAPANAISQNRLTVKNVVAIDGSPFPTWTGEAKLRGGLSSETINDFRRLDLESLNQATAWAFIGPNGKPDVKVNLGAPFLDKSFRDFQSFDFNYSAIGDSPVVSDVAKQSRSLSIASPSYLLMAQLTGVGSPSGSFIGMPGTYTFETIYTGVNALDLVRGDCFIRSSWFDIDRRVDMESQNTRVTETIVVKSSITPPFVGINHVRSSLYSKVVACIRNTSISLSPIELDESQKSLSELVKKFLLAPSTPSEAFPLDQLRQMAKSVLEETYEREHHYVNMKAKRIFDDAVRKNPQDLESHLLIFRVIRSMAMIVGDNYDIGLIEYADQEATGLLQTLPDEAQLYASRGSTRSLAKKHTEAISDLSRAYALSPNDFIVRRTMAAVLEGKGDYETAEKWIKSAYNLITVKDDPVATKRNTSFYWRTVRDIATGKKDTATVLHAHEQIIAVDSNSPWAFHNYAIALSDDKQFDKSIEMSRKALKLMDFGAGRKTLARTLISKAYSNRVGNDDHTFALKPEVEKIMLEAKETNPRDAHVNHWVARFYWSKSIASKESDWLDTTDLYLAEGLKYEPYDKSLRKLDQDLDGFKTYLMKYFKDKGVNPSGRWPASWRLKHGKAPLPEPSIDGP